MSVSGPVTVQLLWDQFGISFPFWIKSIDRAATRRPVTREHLKASDVLDLSQPVHRSVVWFLELAHRGRRLVPLCASGEDFAEARITAPGGALGSSAWSGALPIPSAFSQNHAPISALTIFRNRSRLTPTAFGQ